MANTTFQKLFDSAKKLFEAVRPARLTAWLNNTLHNRFLAKLNYRTLQGVDGP